MGINPQVLLRTLWGDFYLHAKAKKILKGAQVTAPKAATPAGASVLRTRNQMININKDVNNNNTAAECSHLTFFFAADKREEEPVCAAGARQHLEFI